MYRSTIPLRFILLWKLGLGLELDLEFHYFSIFTENNENENLIFREFHGKYRLAKRTQPSDQQQNKITYSVSVDE